MLGGVAVSGERLRTLGEFALDALVDSGLGEFSGYANAVHDGALVR